MFFAIAIAIIPLVVAGRTMIRIAQDELKSSANEQLSSTAQQLTERDQRPLRAHLAGAAAADPERDRQRRARRPGEGGAAHARHRQHRRHRSTADHDQGLADPARGAQRGFRGASRGRLARAPRGVARPARGRSKRTSGSGEVYAQDVAHIPETDDWLATVVLPLGSLLAGQDSRAVGAHRPEPFALLHRPAPAHQAARLHCDRGRARRGDLRIGPRRPRSVRRQVRGGRRSRTRARV